MSLYTMKLSDSVDTMEFNLLEVPIQDKDIEGAVDNVVLSGDIYTDFLWLKKRFTHKWSILCKDDYERLRGFYTRQFSNAEVPIYQLLDAPSPIEESAGSGEYIQITTTDSTAKLASAEMLGKAEQTTYSGKNLFDKDNANILNAYIDASHTSITSNSNNRIIWIPCQPNTTYTLQKLAVGTKWITRQIAYATQEPAVGVQTYGMVDMMGNDTSKTYTTGADAKYLVIRIWVSGQDAETLDAMLGSVQIELGSTATAYEPYVGGTPAPNPSFPQPISVVTGENVVKIEGKNLFDLQASTRTDAGVVFTKTTDTITAIGTTTRGTHAESLSIYDNFSGLGNYPSYATTTATNSFQLPAGTYTFSANITNTGNTKGGLNIGVGTLGARVSTSTKLEKTAGQSGTASATISVAEGQYILLSVWYDGTANTPNVNLSINQVQLEKGNSASQFEPYQGQEFEVNLNGENYFDGSTATTGVGLTWAGGGAYAVTNAITSDFVAISVGQTLKLSHNAQIMFYDSSKAYLGALQVGGTSIAKQQGQVADGCIVPNNTSIAYTRLAFRPADNDGLNMTTQDIGVYIDPIELAKIGNYQDRIYKTGGKWYIEKQVGKVVLDGTENWVAVNSNDTTHLFSTSAITSYALSVLAISTDYLRNNRFNIYNCYGASNTDEGSCYHTDRRVQIRINKSRLATVDAVGFKTWLSTHPTTVYYALATPTTTEITNEALIAQLDALESASLYLGLNYIGTETLNAVPTLALTYFPYYPHEIISPKAVRMELTDGGIINACECRENVQITLRETIQ